MSFNIGGGDLIDRGDRVQQIAPFGLGTLGGFPYVVKTANGELQLSNVPDGPPLTDLQGQPRCYPRQKFRKVTWAV